MPTFVVLHMIPSDVDRMIVCDKCDWRDLQCRWSIAWWRHQMETFSALRCHLCGEFTGHRWIPRTKANDAELWCWVNNGEIGDLRCQRAHYDVIVMVESYNETIWIHLLNAVLWIIMKLRVAHENEGILYINSFWPELIQALLHIVIELSHQWFG